MKTNYREIIKVKKNQMFKKNNVYNFKTFPYTFTNLERKKASKFRMKQNVP